MSSLKIRFAPYSANSGGAIVPLEIFDEKMDRVLAAPMQLDKDYVASVSPGSYLVRVLLPSGELLTSQVSVAEGKTDPVDVPLEPTEQSPREEFAWAYYLQNPANTGSFRSYVARPESIAHNVNLRFRGLELTTKDPKVEVRLFAKRKGEWADITAPNKPELDYSIREQDPRAFATATIRDHYNEALWLVVSGTDIPSRVVALPPPPQGSHAAVRALLYRDLSPSPDPLSVVVELANPQAQSLLAFLAQGKLAAASIIGPSYVEQAKRLVQDKFTDPVAAAIGGYFLLRAAEVDRLHGWIKNLDVFFPWMADGAVIHASHLLQQDSPDVDQARERFLEGEKRGLPLFTQGLRSLFDGLSALNRRKTGDKVVIDTDVEGALARLTPYAAAADWRASVTTFFGSHPKDPSPFLPKA